MGINASMLASRGPDRDAQGNPPAALSTLFLVIGVWFVVCGLWCVVCDVWGVVCCGSDAALLQERDGHAAGRGFDIGARRHSLTHGPRDVCSKVVCSCSKVVCGA